MILERESCTSVQMEIAGCYAKMNRAEPSSSIKRTFHQVDKPPDLTWPTSSHEDMAPSSKPYTK